MRIKGSLSKFTCTKCNIVEMVAGGQSDYKCSPCRTVNGVDPLRTPQYLAHLTVSRSVRYKEIPPASALRCVDCGKKAEHYDHRDYSKPLDISPVCRKCNIARGAAIDKPRKIRDRVEAAIARKNAK